MKLALISLLCCFAMHPLLADETNALPATITIDGVTYSNVTWRTVTPATVTIFHNTGIARIPLEKLPPELQKRFGYDVSKASQWRDADQKANAAQMAAAQQAALEKSFGDKEFTEPLKVGSMGVFQGKVVQILGPKEMIVSLLMSHDVEVPQQRGAPPKSRRVGHDETVLLRGVATAGLVVNQAFSPKGVFKITGTTQDKSSSGTLFVLEPLSP
jgi:hypothetical protein